MVCYLYFLFVQNYRVPVYHILYFMNGDSKVQRATQRSALSSSMLTRNVTLQKPGASYKYIDKLYGGGSDLFRYTDLFSLHFRDRVANYSLLESQIKEAWNSSVNGNLIKLVIFCFEVNVLISYNYLLRRVK